MDDVRASSSASSVHAEPIEVVLTQLRSTCSGLSEQEAERRLRQFGPNRLTVATGVSAFAILRDQLRSVVVALLVAAAAISYTLGEQIEAGTIVAVLVINTLLGFITELRARRAIAGLLQLDVPRAFVVRSGELRALDAHTLVPGDVIALDAGQHIPADGRLIHATELRTQEAALTGESLPVSKSVTTLPVDTPLPDRTNMVYKSTTVAAGTARAVVTGTGANTEIGRIGTLVGGVDHQRTPLERRLDELGRRLVWLALAVAVIVAALGVAQGAPLSLVIEMGIALAVAAVPEALPAVATIALAVGVHRMTRRRALVRRLPAVESLGSTTIVCTDKTRTLTTGDMTAVHLWTGQDIDLSSVDKTLTSDAHLRRALEVMSFASGPVVTATSAQPGIGRDPVDMALLSAADRRGIHRAQLTETNPPVGLLPFSSERKLMASFHRVDGVLVAYVKGAPRQILSHSELGPDGSPLDDAARNRLMGINDRFARAGLRVIALACGPVAEPIEAALGGLTFVGFVGLMDPPAPQVKETIAKLRGAGLRTVMLTGDQHLTAEAIGRQLGLLTDESQLVGGRELDAFSEPELTARVADVGAFSRISPQHKLAIVSALQRRGEIVAMLGDGVNDAPALKKADVGVAMGRGTDIAKDAASIVLQDDRFETIAAAVEEGRVIFDNIQKFVFYLFSCNVAEVLVLLTAALIGLPMPLLPLQVLWLNMVTDTFPALALAMEPGDEGVMRRPPRDPREAILSRPFLTSILGYGALITVATLGAFMWSLQVAPADAVTIAFMTLALTQIFHLGNARSTQSVLNLKRMGANRYAIGAVVVSVALQLAAVHIQPLAKILGVNPLSRGEWAVVVLFSAVPAVVGQMLKSVWSVHRLSAPYRG